MVLNIEEETWFLLIFTGREEKREKRRFDIKDSPDIVGGGRSAKR
jgi:hypothetical protein